MDLTVCICTFGSSDWQALAMDRAFPSAATQARVICRHGETLHDARNEALSLVTSEYVIFLDADDELSPNYVEEMAKGTADLRAPAVSYVRPGGRARPPYVPRVAGHVHDCTAECITSGAGNWIVIGACVRTELLVDVGGFREWPVYEDFCLWLRVLRTGATLEAIPSAVYRAWVRPDSRNRNPAMRDKDRVHREIVAAA